MIRNAIKKLDLDAVIVIPNYEPGHKPGAQSFGVRRALVEAGLRSIPQVIVADEATAIEVSEQGVGAAISKFAREHADQEIVQVMGSDSLDRFKQSLGRVARHYPKNISIAVESREPGYHAPLSVDGIKVTALETTPTGISSTKVRTALSRGETLGPELLHPTVMKLIEKTKLYRRSKLAPSCSALFLRAG